MGIEINNIYKTTYQRNTFAYVGCLRNEKRFNINDPVFFCVNGNEIAYGQIVGVELPPADNSDYRYKIRLPDKLVRDYDGEKFANLICDYIFSSMEEARQSAVKRAEQTYKLELEAIERYFNSIET